jgi:hypothetical protein
MNKCSSWCKGTELQNNLVTTTLMLKSLEEKFWKDSASQWNVYKWENVRTEISGMETSSKTKRKLALGKDVKTCLNSAGPKWLELEWRCWRDWIRWRNGHAVWLHCFLRRRLVSYTKDWIVLYEKELWKRILILIMKADFSKYKV